MSDSRTFFEILAERRGSRNTPEAQNVINQICGFDAVESWFDVLICCLEAVGEQTPHPVLSSPEKLLQEAALLFWATLDKETQDLLAVQFGEEMKDGIRDFRLQYKYAAARLGFFAFAVREIQTLPEEQTS